jgi:hypothetical protein
MLKGLSAAVFFASSLGAASFLGCSSSIGGGGGGGGGLGGGGGMPGDGPAGTGGATVTAGSGGQVVEDAMPIEAAADQGVPKADVGDGVTGHDCASGGYQLCDDFEGTPPGPGSAWTIIKNGYTVETVADQAHSGTHSVHVKATAGAGYGYIEETKTFPATDFWLRAYLRLVAPSGGHEVFVGADTSAMEPQGDQVRYLNNVGSGKFATNRRAGDAGKGSSTAIPMGSWFCFEVHQTPTAVHIFLESKELTDVLTMYAEPTFVSLVLGFERFGGGSAGDIWIDDVAVNAAQIGCD